jgi:hypothetical protein
MRGAAAVLCRYLEVRLFTCCGYPTVAHFLVIAPKRSLVACATRVRRLRSPLLRPLLILALLARRRALTARHPIKLTSPRCPSAWQPNPGRRSTYPRGKFV